MFCTFATPFLLYHRDNIVPTQCYECVGGNLSSIQQIKMFNVGVFQESTVIVLMAWSRDIDTPNSFTQRITIPLLPQASLMCIKAVTYILFGEEGEQRQGFLAATVIKR